MAFSWRGGVCQYQKPVRSKCNVGGYFLQFKFVFNSEYVTLQNKIIKL